MAPAAGKTPTSMAPAAGHPRQSVTSTRTIFLRTRFTRILTIEPAVLSSVVSIGTATKLTDTSIVLRTVGVSFTIDTRLTDTSIVLRTVGVSAIIVVQLTDTPIVLRTVGVSARSSPCWAPSSPACTPTSSSATSPELDIATCADFLQVFILAALGAVATCIVTPFVISVLVALRSTATSIGLHRRSRNCSLFSPAHPFFSSAPFRPSLPHAT